MPRRPVRRTPAVVAVALGVTAALAMPTSSLAAAPSVPARASVTAAQAPVSRADATHRAASYAQQRGYHVGVAVYDTRTGRLYHAGDHSGTFASESVVKVFIAARLLAEGRMHGRTKHRAWKMITQSDDGIASSFYSSVGGDSLINWVKSYFHEPDLGSPPRRANWWGNTHIVPDGLVKLYAKIKDNPVVGPWLLRAMHHAKPYGSDGTYQFFGIPSATKHPAVKQGWGADYDDWGRSADFNTTGFVNGDRYTVAILARGPIATYGSRISDMLTHAARLLLPNGRFPQPAPAVRSVSDHTGPMSGGARLVLRGTNLSAIRAVWFGSKKAAAYHVAAPGRLVVTTPSHKQGRVPVRVVSAYGRSGRAQAFYTFGPRPGVGSLGTDLGPRGGGTTVLIHGRDFRGVQDVRFGSAPAESFRVLSVNTIRAVTPPHGGGTVYVHVVTSYGRSRIGKGGRFTYAVAPSVTAVRPDHGPAAGGTTVVIRGAGFTADSRVRFGGVAATSVTVVSRRKLTAVSPPQAAGVVDVRVSNDVARSARSADDRFTYAGGAGAHAPGHGRFS